MARKPRVWYKGAKYHITCRGNRRSSLFLDRNDYKVYLKILEKVIEQTDFKVYCYCLMTNHIHLEIETNEINIGDIMKLINTRYAIYFNSKYCMDGHLFQGRYGAELIERDDYIVKVSRYIHLNPVKANIVASPEEYEWSSYRMLIGEIEKKLISSEKLLSFFEKGSDNANILYRDFVEGTD
ncbi:MAG: transposase [Clostridiaceae bacterium]